MIYLQVGDEIIEVPDWDHISARPNFVNDLDVNNKKLEKIIGYYDSTQKRTCGLNNCHTPHFKGYIVVTNDGSETNIGNHCGKKYFDVDFENMSSEFINALEYEQLKAAAIKAKGNIFDLWNKINTLTVGAKNINWAITKFRALNDDNVIGTTAYRRLRTMVANRTGNVLFARPPTQDEIDYAVSANQPAPQSVDVVVGQISNIDCLSRENNLEDLFEKSIRGAVQQLQDCDPQKKSRTQLRPIVNGISSLDRNMDMAIQKLELARQFLRKENLEQLINGMTIDENVSRKDIQRYQSFVEGL
ncbi:hypothetical protein [Yersinia intermedia]|uniref:hypothetical protein n=1 Tax=Yersinia intermedia TaxID=631 RepID=UPI0030D1E3F9